MKKEYCYVSKADVIACRELAKTLIKLYNKKGYSLSVDDAGEIEYQVTKFFDCLYSDFRHDFQYWIMNEIEKTHLEH